MKGSDERVFAFLLATLAKLRSTFFFCLQPTDRKRKTKKWHSNTQQKTSDLIRWERGGGGGEKKKILFFFLKKKPGKERKKKN